MSQWYDDYVLSPEWKRKTIEKLLTATIEETWQLFQCEKCKLFVPMGMIDIHHLNYRRVGRELLTDLAVYCRSCHRVHHGYQPTMWWEFARKNGMTMIMQPQINKYLGVKRIGDVVMECLAFADVRHTNRVFREYTKPKHPKVPK